MLHVILAVLMPYQAAKLDKASFDLLAKSAPQKIIIKDTVKNTVKDTDQVVNKEDYQGYIIRRRGRPSSC